MNYEAIWKEQVSLKAACSKIGSGATPRGGKESYKSVGISLIRSQNVHSSGFNRKGLAFIDQYQAQDLDGVTVESDDVLLNITGDSVCRCCQVPSNVLPARVNQHVMIVRPKRDVIDPLYLRYHLIEPKVQSYLFALSSAGATRPALTKGMVEELEIPLPTLPEQQAIASILGSLDDKIDLNRRMNETLESMARTLFKSWFVDFDPVRAKMEGKQPFGMDAETAALFPDRLVESELGLIPEGWDVVALNQQLSFVLGGDWGNSEYSEVTPSQSMCIRGADIANLQLFNSSKMPVRFLKGNSFAKRSLKSWDVVFEISGGSPTQSTGRSVLITPELLRNFELPLTASNFCRQLRFYTKASALFHYLKFRTSYENDEYFQYETGTTGIKNFGFKYFIDQINYSYPSNQVSEKFAEIIGPYFKMMGIAMRENEVLISIRDLLLPKLLSGEIRVKEAEQMVEAAV